MCDSMPATHQRALFETDPNDLGFSVIDKTSNGTTMHKFTNRCVRKGRNGVQDKAAAAKSRLIKARTDKDDGRQHSALQANVRYTAIYICVPDMMKVMLVGGEGVLVVKGVKVRWLR